VTDQIYALLDAHGANTRRLLLMEITDYTNDAKNPYKIFTDFAMCLSIFN